MDQIHSPPPEFDGGPPPLPRRVDENELRGALLGEILIATAGLDAGSLAEALAEQRERGGRIGEILVGKKAVNEVQVLKALCLQLDCEFLEEIDTDSITRDIIGPLPINFAKQYRVFPVREEMGVVIVATPDPTNLDPLGDLQVLYGKPVLPAVAPTQRVIDAINKVFDRLSGEAAGVMDDLEGESLDDLAHELEEPEDLLDASDEAPIIRLVNSLLSQAVKERASDIHIEPFERELSVRFRVDGVLYEVIKPPKRFQASIISRVKIMAGLNIAEKRLPQDGRIRIKIAGKDIDIRLSTIPTSHGERIVMRLLDKTAVLLDLESLGFPPKQLETINTLIHKSHGIMLVTGPTGSGKTTTLYSCLARINSPDKNILTVEDPVEYQMKGIGQMQVQSKIGLSFASGLRSFLRQDPDVILVGEIRDLETAEIAIQASLTGHLVFSTVHTNDAPGAVTRLVDMGVEPFLVASSIVGILAQRLLRKVCQECKEPYVPTAAELAELGLPPNGLALHGKEHVYRPKGCDVCLGTGYAGRFGIYELMLMEDEVRQLTLQNVDSGTIKKAAVKNGMITLREDGARNVLEGKTTIEEVMRVTQVDTEVE